MRIEEFSRPGPATETTDSGVRPDAGPTESSPGLDSGASKPAGAAVTIPTQKAAAPAWVLPLEHFSYTGLQMLEICPEQWRNRYVLGRKEPPAQALLLGKVTHGGVEYGLAHKALTEQDPDLDSMLAYYHDLVWPDTLEAYGGKGEVIWDDNPEEVRGQGERMVKAYHPTISRLEPETVEEEFTLDLGLPIPVKGWIDLTQKHGRPSVDLKTSQSRRSELRPDWRVQARVYQLAAPVAVDFHVITKSKLPAVVTGLEETGLVEPYREKQAEQMRRRLGQALWAANYYYATYGPDETWPTRGIHHDWRCKWCAFRPDCPEWSS
jgi:PD-(D/E)XK nuclease superfamily